MHGSPLIKIAILLTFAAAASANAEVGAVAVTASDASSVRAPRVQQQASPRVHGPVPAAQPGELATSGRVGRVEDVVSAGGGRLDVVPDWLKDRLLDGCLAWLARVLRRRKAQLAELGAFLLCSTPADKSAAFAPSRYVHRRFSLGRKVWRCAGAWIWLRSMTRAVTL